MRFENTYLEFGELLKKLRISMSLTQSDLAKKVELSRASIANIESGRQKVLLHHVYLFARCLNVDPAALMPKAETAIQSDNIIPLGTSTIDRSWIESIMKQAENAKS